MKICYSELVSHDHWFSDKHPTLRSNVPEQWHQWLCADGSLTSKLINYSNNHFEVRVLREVWQRPLPHEQRKLKMPSQQIALVREVELFCEGKAVVFARSIIPNGSVAKQLQKLGSRPLGHLLFNKGRMRISQREIAVLESDNTKLYARRTPYKYLQQEILISEFFIDQAYFIR